MKNKSVLLSVVLVSGSLISCSGLTEDKSDETKSHKEEAESPGIEMENPDSEETDGNSSAGEADESQNNELSDGMGLEEESVDEQQKKMAMDTLYGLIKDAKKGKVYKLTNQFYVGKTTQTDVWNAIGKPERQDAFDRYTGSMGRASYDLRYNNEGVLIEARYLGTNVERQTNLGGITLNDLQEHLGDPDETIPLSETDQTSYIYNVDSFQLKFVMSEKDVTDHVNLLVK